MVGRECADSSRVFVTFGADDYLPANGLKLRHDVICGEEVDWFSSTKIIFYDIPTGKIALYDLPNRREVTHGKAIKADVARRLVGNSSYKAQDNWYFRKCQELSGNEFRVYVDESDGWKQGFCTNGFNTMSEYRSRYVTADPPQHPFGPCDKSCLQIPQDITEALVGAKMFLQMHRRRGIGVYDV